MTIDKAIQRIADALPPEIVPTCIDLQFSTDFPSKERSMHATVFYNDIYGERTNFTCHIWEIQIKLNINNLVLEVKSRANEILQQMNNQDLIITIN